MDAGELDEAERVLAEARRSARPRDDDAPGAAARRAPVPRAAPRRARSDRRRARRSCEQAIPIFEQAGDEHGLCRAWQLRASADWTARPRVGRSRSLGTGGRARPAGRRGARAGRHPGLARLLDLVGRDARRRRHPPLRGDPGRGARTSRVARPRSPPARRPARLRRALRARALALRRERTPPSTISGSG